MSRLPLWPCSTFLVSPSGFLRKKDPALTPKIAKSVWILDLGSHPIFQGPHEGRWLFVLRIVTAQGAGPQLRLSL